MNIDQLIEEARKIARPCVDLTQDDNGVLAAIWDGPGLVENRVAPSCSSGIFRHWLSWDCRFMPPEFEDLRGCLSLYMEEWCEENDPSLEGELPDEWPAIVASDESRQLSRELSLAGTKLFAHSSLSWPWIDAVFRFGSPAIQEWLADCDWQPKWVYNNNFRDSNIVADYEEFLRSRDPYFGEMEDVFARLGGWHLPWPEDDWVELLDKRLVAMTYRDAEPWLEVWLAENGDLDVLERIT